LVSAGQTGTRAVSLNIISTSQGYSIMDASYYDWHEYAMNPSIGTDRGVCTRIVPEVLFHPLSLWHQFQVDFHPEVRENEMPGFAKRFNVKRGATSGKEQGLSLLVDTESYDHGYKGSPGALVQASKGGVTRGGTLPNCICSERLKGQKIREKKIKEKIGILGTNSSPVYFLKLGHVGL
jgi:hypothetical protein